MSTVKNKRTLLMLGGVVLQCRSVHTLACWELSCWYCHCSQWCQMDSPGVDAG